MSIFDEKNVLPMHFYQGKEFDSEDYIYEIKFDGFRAIIYLDKDRVTIRTRNNNDVTHLYPELHNLNKCSSKKCILDGELIVMGDNGPDFFKMQQRGRMKVASRIKKAAQENPVEFVAFDILYYDNQDLTDLPLMERKEYLNKIKENNNLTISKYIEKRGINLFEKVKKQGLEGVVAKKKNSVYEMGKRTHSWVKFKAIKEEDFWILGYKEINHELKTIIIGQKQNNQYNLYGEVNFPNVENQEYLRKYAQNNLSSKELFPLKNVIWLKPKLQATIRFKEITPSNNLRHAVFVKFVD